MLPKYLQQLRLLLLLLLPRWTQMNMATDYIWDWDWGIAELTAPTSQPASNTPNFLPSLYLRAVFLFLPSTHTCCSIK